MIKSNKYIKIIKHHTQKKNNKYLFRKFLIVISNR